MLILLSLYSFAQTFPVTGKITDANGEPLAGVTVQVKGSEARAVSNNDGSFTINAPSSSAVLIFSYVGFADKELSIKNSGRVSVSMAPAAGTLQDVVVVGYGTQRKSDVTGALTSISARTIQERPVTNLAQALQGKAAGMNVATNIKPGELPAIRIRGTRSISGGNDPLYVVDGIPIVSALGVTSFSINDINPNDIASVEILKDASATAIYGSRGSNGVILITTKKGTKGRVSVSYNSSVSLDRYKALTDPLGAGEYIDRIRLGLINARNYQAAANTSIDLKVAPTAWYPDPNLDRVKFPSSGVTNNFTELINAAMTGYEWNPDGSVKTRATTAEEQALGWGATVPIYNSENIRGYDWVDEASRTGITQNHQIALSSGTDVTRLYLSFGYNNQLGVQRDQDFRRFNVNANGEITATKWITLGISMIASISEQDFGLNANQGNTGTKDLYGRALDQYPWAAPRDSAGFFVRNPGGRLDLWNPLVDINQSINNRRTSSALSNIFTEIKFTPWLKYRLNFGAQIRNFRNGAWTGPDATSHINAAPNTAGYSKDESFSWVAENLLYFDKTFSRAHTVGVTLLQSTQKSRRESISTSVAGTVVPVSLWYDLSSNTRGTPTGYGTSFTENTLMSYMGRLNYNLLNKYLLTVSGRYDGASVLAPGHKWDFFPSFALAWKMQEEKFLSGITWITELKPRVGYGVTGSSSVSPYTTSGPLSRNNYVFGATPAIGFLPQLVKNPDLGWEQTKQWNYGLDFSVVGGRVSGSLEYYDQKTSDLLWERSIPAVSGYVSKVMNIGKTRNKGIEITLSTINVRTQNFTWSTELNFSKNKEEIIELVNGKQDLVANRLFIGQSLQVFYQLEHAGIWGNGAKELDEMAKFNAAAPAGGGHRFYPGFVKVVDQNGDYKISAEDYVILGTSRPDWYGGITNTVKYRDLSLSTFIYARIGQTYFGGYQGLFSNGENNYWTWNNQNGKWPVQIVGPTPTPVDNISAAMQYNDGSFFVVRNISLTYDLPARLISRAKMKNLQVNVQVLNPFIFGGDVVKMGINPDDETNWASESQPNSFATNPVGGVNNNTILPQSIVFGLRVGF
ncbi:MAG: TonB-dependent receptor [Chitinophagaceae bacterium]|nr:TonB-dependent receptor [Chitinophagaceae bacterium]